MASNKINKTIRHRFATRLELSSHTGCRVLSAPARQLLANSTALQQQQVI